MPVPADGAFGYRSAGTRDIVLGSPAPSARDALHAAVMRQHDIQEILSFNRGFDDISGIRRVGA